MKKNKGFTILETVAYLSISLIIISIAITSTIKSYRELSGFIKKNREMNQVYNAFNFIDYWCYRDKVFEVKKSGDKLEIYEAVDGTQYSLKRIYKNGENLSMFHYDVYNVKPVANNPIIENIDDFKVYKKENLIYISIIKGGEEYMKCI